MMGLSTQKKQPPTSKRRGRRKEKDALSCEDMAATLRALWVVKLPRADEASVVVWRRFGSVEVRAKAAHAHAHVPIPATPAALCRAFADAILRHDQPLPLLPSAAPLSSCVPVRQVCALASGLWPVCWVERGDDVYCIAVPLVQRTSLERRLASEELACISSTFGVLEDVAGLCAPYHPRYEPQGVAELQAQIGIALPFGKPQITNADTVRAVAKAGGFPVDSARVPGWRPIWPAKSPKGGRVEFALEETIDAAQYDSAATPDVLQVHGAIAARVELDSPAPEITLNVACADDTVERIAFHHCTQLGNEIFSAAGIRVQFVPPPVPFVLATYSVKRPQRLPIRGFY
jgi:hypothetical protein